jgi:hypothetical protein
VLFKEKKMRVWNLKLLAAMALMLFVAVSCTKNPSNALTSESINTPSLYSPANKSVVDSLKTTIIWNTVANAALYEFQISSKQDFSDTLMSDSLPENYRNITKWDSLLTPNATYYWRVRAISSGGTSRWSSISCFSEHIEPPYMRSFSYQEYMNISLTPVINWDTVSGPNAVKYQLQISKDYDFDSIVVNTMTVADSFKVIQPLSYGTAYETRVRAISNFDTSDWSYIEEFYTLYNTPGKTVLAYPANGAKGILGSDYLSWVYEKGSATYDIQVAADPNFTNILFQTSGTTSKSYSLSSCMANTTYYWRVRTTNSMGTGTWSDVWSFTTAYFVQLLSPYDTERNVGSPATLTWSAVPGVSTYWVKLYSSSGTFLNDSTITTTSISVDIFTSYSCYWQVCGIFPDGTKTAWSSQWSFKRN